MKAGRYDMFYFLIYPFLSYNFILIAAAIIPAVILMVHVYRSDHLEKESGNLLWTLVKAGVFSTLVAIFFERIFSALLGSLFSPESTIYRILLYFGVVAISEEGAKYYQLKKNTWNREEFNCLYDGVIYAVFVSMGFALWENISYVLHYGLSVALIRAVTSIPGHACFGVFMGVFYTAAKLYSSAERFEESKRYQIAALVVPMLLHGAYDYIATLYSDSFNYLFIAFVAVLFFVSYKLVDKVARNDQYFR